MWKTELNTVQSYMYNLLGIIEFYIEISQFSKNRARVDVPWKRPANGRKEGMEGVRLNRFRHNTSRAAHPQLADLCQKLNHFLAAIFPRHLTKVRSKEDEIQRSEVVWNCQQWIHLTSLHYNHRWLTQAILNAMETSCTGAKLPTDQVRL